MRPFSHVSFLPFLLVTTREKEGGYWGLWGRCLRFPLPAVGPHAMGCAVPLGVHTLLTYLTKRCSQNTADTNAALCPAYKISPPHENASSHTLYHDSFLEASASFLFLHCRPFCRRELKSKRVFLRRLLENGISGVCRSGGRISPYIKEGKLYSQGRRSRSCWWLLVPSVLVANYGRKIRCSCLSCTVQEEYFSHLPFYTQCCVFLPARAAA